MINTFYNLGSQIYNFPSNYCERILRICVFQHAENAGQFEKCLVRIYKFFSQGICSIGYDRERAERGQILFQELGASFLTLALEEEIIDTMHLDPAQLESVIIRHGGSWGNFILNDGRAVIAIKPPKISTHAWSKLESAFLKMGWAEQEGLFVTCPYADVLTDQKNLFIQLNSASTCYMMMRKRIGLFLGCKQTVVVFDPPGTGRSSGIASEGAYYKAIKTVYDHYSKDFAQKNIWVGGACLGTMSAAYLRSQFSGVNLFLENGFVDLQEDFVKPQGAFNLWFVKRYWHALFSKSSEEAGFNIETMWKGLPLSNVGKVIVINIENDQRVSQEVASKLYKQAALVNSKVYRIHYISPNKDPHFSRFDDMPDVPRKVLRCIFT